jgi:DNA-binding NarL/FixJ family response regulator
MKAAQQQKPPLIASESVVLASPDRAWCDRIQAAIDSDAFSTDLVLRLTDPPEVGLPVAHGCLWLVDEAWLAPLLARHAARGEPVCSLRLIVRFEQPCSERIVQAIEAGARGCLAGDADACEVLRAIAAVRNGELWLSRQLFSKVLTHLQTLVGAHRVDEGTGRLTERQRQIAACVAEGMSNKQIGRRLGISPTTVKTHLHNIFERVGVGGRTLLAMRALDGDAR